MLVVLSKVTMCDIQRTSSNFWLLFNLLKCVQHHSSEYGLHCVLWSRLVASFVANFCQLLVEHNLITLNRFIVSS